MWNVLVRLQAVGVVYDESFNQILRAFGHQCCIHRQYRLAVKIYTTLNCQRLATRERER